MSCFQGCTLAGNETNKIKAFLFYEWSKETTQKFMEDVFQE
jgi:hypothetical protein